MEKKAKSFAIYCSHGASRVLKFYSYQKNLIEYKPKIVVYDGGKNDVINKLRDYFQDCLLVIDKNDLTADENRKIHATTSAIIHRALVQNRAEYLLCFGDKILKKELIFDFPNKLINFHPSILPSFKGLLAIDQALQNNSVFLGNTAHFIDEGIDTGKIIVQTAMLKETFENYEDVLELQFPMIKMVLRDLLSYEISASEVVAELELRKKLFIIPKFCNS